MTTDATRNMLKPIKRTCISLKLKTRGLLSASKYSRKCVCGKGEYARQKTFKLKNILITTDGSIRMGKISYLSSIILRLPIFPFRVEFDALEQKNSTRNKTAPLQLGGGGDGRRERCCAKKNYRLLEIFTK